MIDVDDEVRRFVGERPPAAWAWMRDPEYHAQMTLLRNFVKLMEAALQAEGIPENMRLRVVRTTLFGAPDPYEAIARVFQHEAEIQRLMKAPADTLRLQMTEVRHS